MTDQEFDARIAALKSAQGDAQARHEQNGTPIQPSEVVKAAAVYLGFLTDQAANNAASVS